MKITERFFHSADWALHAKRTYCPARLDPSRRPLVIVPGYGMNTFIFGFHPRGSSMERSLANAGFEVWSLNMRGQGPSHPQHAGAEPPTLRAYAEHDLAAGIDGILENTRSNADRVDVIGASLGGSIVYAHLALLPERHRIASVVTIGAPLRWGTLHPLVALAFASPRIAGRVGFNGTQQLARMAFPLLSKIPGVLNLYMNTKNIDIKRAKDLTRTVDKVHPLLNRDLARWMKNHDMIFDGLNVTESLAKVYNPLFMIHGNRDGIVPADSVRAAGEAWGGDDVALLEVGTPDVWYAHADLFVGHEAQKEVFEPMAAWLQAR